MTETQCGIMYGTLLGLLLGLYMAIGFFVGRTTMPPPLECPAVAPGGPAAGDQPSADVVVPHEAPRAHKRT